MLWDQLENDAGGPTYYLISFSSPGMCGQTKRDNNPFASFSSIRKHTFAPQGDLNKACVFE